MIRNTAIILTIVLTSILLFFFASRMLTPGALSKGHQFLKSKCLSCHNLFKGISKKKCLSCHKEIVLIKSAENQLGPDTFYTRKTFHYYLIENKCIFCHSEHSGAQADITTHKFNHGIFRKSIIGRCPLCHRPPDENQHKHFGTACRKCHTFNAWRPADFNHKKFFNENESKYINRQECTPCHKVPDDNRHRDFGDRCGDCHIFAAWKPANFNHSKYFDSYLYGVAKLTQCNPCHKPPGDTLHRGAGKKCRDCHNFDSWRNVTFKHSKYFRFNEDHGSRCSNCHLSNNFKEYTCYRCHEHSERRIRASHKNKKIRYYRNCVKCHQGGDEGYEGEEEEEEGDD